nr:lectin-like protein [uncultured Desulfobulbus sp.]
MKKIVLAAIATSAFLVANSSIASACHIEAETLWTTNGHTYAIGSGVGTSGKTWEEANTWVKGYNTDKGLTGDDAWYLATITSAEENNFIFTLLSQYGQAWAGATDKTTEGTWEWVTSEAFTYDNWNAATHEPNNSGNEDFLELNRWTNTTTWNDLGSSRLCYWVVEKGGFSPVPEPATMLLFGSGIIGLAAANRKRSQKS